MICLIAEGKIVKALSGFYYVMKDNTVYQCRARGVFRKRKITPYVGDIVQFEKNNEREGYILDILPRKNELLRPPIANVDQALVAVSVKEPDVSLQLLDKFLVHVEANDIDALVCFTKMDLLSDEERENFHEIAEIYRAIGYPVLLLSIKDETSVEAVKPYLKDKITVVAGQSGVGKSSLLNALDPSLQIETKAISAHLGRGRHTTRHVELISVAGGLVADTPGFSSLDLSRFQEQELSMFFPEMKRFSKDCKFRGCTHLTEPECAVKTALEAGEIAQSRYRHYEIFYHEIKETKRRY